jgi:hypothetical protein
VAAHDWATWHQTIGQNMPRVSRLFVHICQPISTTSTTTSVYEHATSSYGLCYIIIRRLPRQHLYRLYSRHNFFLPIWRFEQKAISLSSDVHLNRNKFCWVCDDEGYTPIQFEAILRTLIFELNFYLWSRF